MVPHTDTGELESEVSSLGLHLLGLGWSQIGVL